MTGTATVAKKERTKGRDRIDMRVDPDWELAVYRHARSMGMPLTSYISFAVIKQMERDRAEREALKQRRG